MPPPTKKEYGLLRGIQRHIGYRGCSPRAATLVSVFVLLSLQTQQHGADGFSTSRSAIFTDRTRYSLQSLVPLNYAEESDANGLPTLSGSLTDRSLHEFELKDHKPLGCSVEESLAHEPDGARYVFVAEINKGGNADKAGLRAGDVIVQLSGTFDEVVDVAGLGIEKIRSLVSGRLDESPLIMRVARGSDVMERHELALLELCIVGDDAATAECITQIYSMDDDMIMDEDNDTTMCTEDDGTECMLDSMWNGWSEGLVPIKEEKEEEVKVVTKKKVAPWSSRSSPSGTDGQRVWFRSRKKKRKK